LGNKKEYFWKWVISGLVVPVPDYIDISLKSTENTGCKSLVKKAIEGHWN